MKVLQSMVKAGCFKFRGWWKSALGRPFQAPFSISSWGAVCSIGRKTSNGRDHLPQFPFHSVAFKKKSRRFRARPHFLTRKSKKSKRSWRNLCEKEHKPVEKCRLSRWEKGGSEKRWIEALARPTNLPMYLVDTRPMPPRTPDRPARIIGNCLSKLFFILIIVKR